MAAAESSRSVNIRDSIQNIGSQGHLHAPGLDSLRIKSRFDPMADGRPRIPTRDVVMVNPDGSDGFCLFIACTLGISARDRRDAENRARELERRSAEVQAVLEACIGQLVLDLHHEDPDAVRLRLRNDDAPMDIIGKYEGEGMTLLEAYTRTLRERGWGGQFEYAAIARAYNVEINVYQELEEGWLTAIDRAAPGGGEMAGPPIDLFFQNGHYQLMFHEPQPAGGAALGTATLPAAALPAAALPAAARPAAARPAAARPAAARPAARRPSPATAFEAAAAVGRRRPASSTTLRRIKAGQVVRHPAHCHQRARIGPGFSIPYLSGDVEFEATACLAPGLSLGTIEPEPDTARLDGTNLTTVREAADGFSMFRAFSTATWAHNGGCGDGCPDARGGAGRGRGGTLGAQQAERELRNIVARVLDEVRQEDFHEAVRMSDAGFNAFRARVLGCGATESGDDAALLQAMSRAYNVRIDVHVRLGNDLTLVREAVYLPHPERTDRDRPHGIVSFERLPPGTAAGGIRSYGAIVSRSFMSAVRSHPIRRLKDDNGNNGNNDDNDDNGNNDDNDDGVAWRRARGVQACRDARGVDGRPAEPGLGGQALLYPPCVFNPYLEVVTWGRDERDPSVTSPVPRNRVLGCREATLIRGDDGVEIVQPMRICHNDDSVVTGLCLGFEAIHDPESAVRKRGVGREWGVAREMRRVLGLPVNGDVMGTIQNFSNTKGVQVEVYLVHRFEGVWKLSWTARPDDDCLVPADVRPQNVVRIGIRDYGRYAYQLETVVFLPRHPRRRAPAGPQRVLLAAADGLDREIVLAHDVVDDDHSMISALFVAYTGLESLRRALTLKGVSEKRREVKEIGLVLEDHLADDDLFLEDRDGNSWVYSDVLRHFPDFREMSQSEAGLVRCTDEMRRAISADSLRAQLRLPDERAVGGSYTLKCFARVYGVPVHVYGKRDRMGDWARLDGFEPPTRAVPDGQERVGGAAGATVPAAPAPPEIHHRVIRIGYTGTHFIALLRIEDPVPARRQPGRRAGPGSGPAQAPPPARPLDSAQDTQALRTPETDAAATLLGMDEITAASAPGAPIVDPRGPGPSIETADSAAILLGMGSITVAPAPGPLEQEGGTSTLGSRGRGAAHPDSLAPPAASSAPLGARTVQSGGLDRSDAADAADAACAACAARQTPRSLPTRSASADVGRSPRSSHCRGAQGVPRIEGRQAQ